MADCFDASMPSVAKARLDAKEPCSLGGIVSSRQVFRRFNTASVASSEHPSRPQLSHLPYLQWPPEVLGYRLNRFVVCGDAHAQADRRNSVPDDQGAATGCRAYVAP